MAEGYIVYSIAWLLFGVIILIAPCQIRFLEHTRNRREFPRWRDITWRANTNKQNPRGTPDWVYFSFAAILFILSLGSLLLQDDIIRRSGEIKYVVETHKIILKLLLAILASASFTARYGVYFVGDGEQKKNFWLTAISVYFTTGFIVGKTFFIRWLLAVTELSFFFLIAIYFHLFQ